MDFSPLFTYDSFLLSEADDDTPAADAPAETNDAGGDQDAGDADNNQDTGDDAGGDDNQDSDNNDSDLDINIDDSSSSDSFGGGGSDSSSSSSSGSGNGDPNASVDTEAKKQDRKLFDSLTPQEQKLKTLELKKLYMDLYDNCEQLSEKFEVLGVEFDELSPAITGVMSNLFNLKNMISTHLLYLFDAKTYYENDVQFNQFLLALNKIKLVSDDMVKQYKEEIQIQKEYIPTKEE